MVLKFIGPEVEFMNRNVRNNETPSTLARRLIDHEYTSTSRTSKRKLENTHKLYPITAKQTKF